MSNRNVVAVKVAEVAPKDLPWESGPVTLGVIEGTRTIPE